MKQFNDLQQLAYDVYLKRKTLQLETIDPQKLVRITRMNGFQKLKKQQKKWVNRIQKDSTQPNTQQFTQLGAGKDMLPIRVENKCILKKDSSITYQDEIVGYICMIETYVYEDKINIEKIYQYGLVEQGQRKFKKEY